MLFVRSLAITRDLSKLRPIFVYCSDGQSIRAADARQSTIPCTYLNSYLPHLQDHMPKTTSHNHQTMKYSPSIYGSIPPTPSPSWRFRKSPYSSIARSDRRKTKREEEQKSNIDIMFTMLKLQHATSEESVEEYKLTTRQIRNS